MHCFLLFSFLCSPAFAVSNGFSFSVYSKDETSNQLQELHDLCLSSLLNNYENLGLTAADLGTDNIRQVLEDFWAEEVGRFESKDFRWLIAKCQEEIVGYVSFDLQNAPKEVVLQLLCVKPSFQSRGIGKELLRSLFQIVDQPEKIVLVTRKANTSAIAFYKHIGFREAPHVTKRANVDTQLCTQLEIDLSINKF